MYFDHYVTESHKTQLKKQEKPSNTIHEIMHLVKFNVQNLSPDPAPVTQYQIWKPLCDQLVEFTA